MSRDALLAWARQNATRRTCPVCGKRLVVRPGASRQVAGVTVRLRGCPVHHDVVSGTVEVGVPVVTVETFLAEYERDRRRKRRVKREEVLRVA